MNYITAAAMESIKKSYEFTFLPIAFMRNVSINLLNNLGFLKEYMQVFANNHPFGPKNFEWESK